MEIGDEDHDDRPEGKESWARWLREKKDGKDRKDRISEMLPKLNNAVSLLNLGLSTLAAQPAICARVQPGTPILFVPDAAVKARRMVEEFLFGRGSFWWPAIASFGGTFCQSNFCQC